ncbi:MAG: hypothetical protein COA88_07640 [Kordia sp.]|nr:MAG: hypothetical protein COA88_07640 [Kordia sp.]
MKASKKIILIIITFFIHSFLYAQVGIGTTEPKASLDISVPDPANPNSNHGLLVPRITNFPVVNPALAQQGMLVFMNNDAAFAGKGFYYWNMSSVSWIPLGENKWGEGVNTNGDGLIYAVNANDNGTKIVVKDDGYVGMGTDDPLAELHVLGSRSTAGTDVELTIENSVSEAELQLIPGGVGSSIYTFVANDDATTGLSIYEGTEEKIQIKAGGDLRIDELKSTKNLGVVYPASVYVESDGTLKVKTAYSRLDDLTVNNTDFVSATKDYAESITANGTDTSDALYTHTLTPTQDILLEVSYHVAVNFSKYGTLADPIAKQHNTKLYGTIVKLDGVDYTYKTGSFIGNSGLNGAFIASDHLYIPLVADGSTYNITIHGYVKNDSDDLASGIRATFGGDIRDRLQIMEHK